MRRVMPLVMLLLCAGLLCTSFQLLDGGVWQQRHLVGLGLLVPSLLLWTIARYQLGSAFTARAEARRLVTHGLYARIRHPIYIFAELATVGLFIFIGLPWLFALFLITVPIQVRRARREDRVLQDAFGEDYCAYRSRAWL